METGGAPTRIDAKTGKVVWKNNDIGRTISTISVMDDLVYLAEYAGIIHCLDANTGKVAGRMISLADLGPTLVVDGKVLLGNEDGDLLVMDHGKDKPKVKLVGMGAPAYVLRCLQTVRFTSRRKPTCTRSESEHGFRQFSSGRSLVWLLFVAVFAIRTFGGGRILPWFLVFCPLAWLHHALSIGCAFRLARHSHGMANELKILRTRRRNRIVRELTGSPL